MPIKTRLFTSLSCCLALVWAVVVCLGVPEAFGDNDPLYRLHRYEKGVSSVTIWFRGSDSLSQIQSRRRLRLPVKLARRQTLVDGIISGKKCILAAMRDGNASIFELTAGTNWNRLLSVKERPPTKEDQSLFEELFAAGKNGDGVRTMAVPSCEITIWLANFNCTPCNTLKTAYPANSFACPQIKHVKGGSGPWPMVSWPAGGPTPNEDGRRETPTAMSLALNYCSHVCNAAVVPPGVQPPANPPTIPDSSKLCPGRYGPGHTFLCGTASGGYQCCNPETQNCVRPSGQSFGYCTDKPTPSQPPVSPPADPDAPTKPQPTCPSGKTAKWNPPVCDKQAGTCHSGYWECVSAEQPEPPIEQPSQPRENQPVHLPPPAPPQTCEGQGKKTCSKGDAKWCCERSESCGTNVYDCRPAAPDLPATPPSPPSGPCSVTYSCRYTDDSTGSGTVTCSPQATSVSGHWGSMDCKTCKTSFNPHCGIGTTRRSGPKGNPPPSVGSPGARQRPILRRGGVAHPRGPIVCNQVICRKDVRTPKIRGNDRSQ